MTQAIGPETIIEGLREAGIDLLATLPDINLYEVLSRVAKDPDFIHVPLCREEEGIGVCAGAYMAGKRAAMIVQNGGLLNSCNALASTALHFQIPMLLLVYYAGDIGDRTFATVGSVTEPVLRGLGIRYYVPRRLDEVKSTITRAQILAEDSRYPVAILLTRDILEA
ncbi:MAG: sulfopyruvate decarboxylase subunit alpha [Chloroflexi bacterium]|nr:sulfopyruvate decarboxylase subunit alpha [Chloroflexota bacterium]